MKRAKSKSVVRKPQRNITRNHLWIYRKRMGYSQKFVASLLEHKSAAHISDYERGKRLPCLKTALKLEIILCVPVAFIYKPLYMSLKKNIQRQKDLLQHKNHE